MVFWLGTKSLVCTFSAVAGEIESESRHEFKFASKQGLEASDTSKGKAAGKTRSYSDQ